MIRGVIASNRIELDKLYFFIAVSTRSTRRPPQPANQTRKSRFRKSNVPFPVPDSPHGSSHQATNLRFQPISDPPTPTAVASLAWQTSLRHFPGTCYFIHSLPFCRDYVLVWKIARAKNEREKAARNTETEYYRTERAARFPPASARIFLDRDARAHATSRIYRDRESFLIYCNFNKGL